MKSGTYEIIERVLKSKSLDKVYLYQFKENLFDDRLVFGLYSDSELEGTVTNGVHRKLLFEAFDHVIRAQLLLTEEDDNESKSDS